MFSRSQLSLAFTLLSLGILMSVQFRTTQEALKSLRAQSQQDLAITLKNQSEKKYTLEREQWDIQVKLKALDSASGAQQDAVKALKDELADLNGLAGAAALKGPGVRITIPASTPIVTEEVISIINEMWNVSSEAVAVNGIRITSYTPITETEYNGTLVTQIDGNPVNYPYIITAIGNSEKLLSGINIAGGTIDLLRVNQTIIEVEKVTELVLPVARQPMNLRFATVTQQVVPIPAPGESPTLP